MTRPLLVGLAALALAACAARSGRVPGQPEPAPGMAGVGAEPASQATRAQALSMAVLPAIQLTATLLTDSPLLQRPQKGSAVLKTLAAGTVAELLGDLDNAEGQWLSVSVDGTQGWIRAAQARR